MGSSGIEMSKLLNHIEKSKCGGHYVLRITSDKYVKELKISAEDVFIISSIRWGFKNNYAIQSKRGSKVYLHKLILGLPDCMVDHINRDTSDNRRENLRLATASENAMNRSPYKGKSYKGVSTRVSKYTGKTTYIARLLVKRKCVYFKTFNNLEEAIKAYNENAIKIFGEFANINEEKYA